MSMCCCFALFVQHVLLLRYDRVFVVLACLCYWIVCVCCLVCMFGMLVILCVCMCVFRCVCPVCSCMLYFGLGGILVLFNV